MRSGLEAIPLRNSGKACNISGSGVLSGSSVIVCPVADSVSPSSLSSSSSICLVSVDCFLRTPPGSWGTVAMDIRLFSI